jgi:RNA polymerase sigma-70 factor (ECF subfamily)
VPDGVVPPELVSRCRLGDPRAFEELVRLTDRRVYGLALRLVKDPYDAEDVAQEAYLRMFRGLAGFREEARFETWMHRIVTNTALNHIRRRGRFGDLFVEDREPEIPVADETEPSADRDRLERALSMLPEGQRVPLVLKDVYGLSCKEIGRELGIEEGAVKVRLHRARRKLQDLLAPKEGSDEV